MPETSLYPAVKRFLEGAGFCVKGEVNGCDAVAVKEDGQLRLAIVEMKLGFNLDLLLQVMDRMLASTTMTFTSAALGRRWGAW